MCGITGFISREDGVSIEGRTDLLRRMCGSIAHRGPDDEGIFVEGNAAIGMRRLAVIDLQTGKQPMFCRNGELAIVFNGEIYNFRELRAKLEARGHVFITSSDTEAVLRAFDEYGESCLTKLRGMFAFAVWDSRERSLFLARDRMGKKPLFYALTAQGDFVFGSELRTLLTHGAIAKQIDLAAMDAYLSFGYVPEEFCILEGVKKLEPGHCLTFREGQVRTSKYWDFDLSLVNEARTEEEWAELVREKLDEAVRIRMISEVPLGAFLSGGIDSSSIVGLMARHSARPVKTFSIGFDEDEYDELKFARAAARRFGTEHHEFIVTADMVDAIGTVVDHFDEPFADQSSLPTFLLSKMAREHVTVVLSGDGGDELFAGYERYAVELGRTRFDRVPATVRELLIRPLGSWAPHGTPGKNLLYNISLDAVGRYIDSVSAFNQLRKSYLFSSSLARQLNGSGGAGERTFRRIAEGSAAGHLGSLLRLDAKTYLPGDILTKVDRMTMANSLEARAPLLDHELVELAASIPADLKMKHREQKYIFKKAMEGVVPREILYRKKQGFGVPITEWINTRLREQIKADLLSEKAMERGFFQKRYIQTLIGEHFAGRRDHSAQLWMLWMLELWLRRNIDP